MRPRRIDAPRRAAQRCALALACVFAAPSPGRAFTEFTSVSDDCHERITLGALDVAGWPEGAAPPAPSDLDPAIAEDLPFRLASERRDPWTVALLMAVRYPDLAGFEPSDLPALAALAADPETQDRHCLRASWDDGPEGDLAALDACKARIRAEVERAIGEGDALDVEATDRLPVWLTFRDTIELDLARLPFRLGLALHALQDSFSHVLRDPETGAVRHVLNYVDPLKRGDDEARDGHGHEGALDECRGGPESRVRRVGWAEEASADLLAAVAMEATSRDERLARVDAVLDRWLAYAPGCDASNGYCDAPELDERAPGCEAGAPGAGGSDGGGLPLVIGAAAIVAARARRRRRDVMARESGLRREVPGRESRRGRVLAALAAALVACATPSRAAAQDAAEVEPDPTDERVRALALEPDVQIVDVDREEDEATVVAVEARELTGGTPIDRGPGLALSGFGGIDDVVLGVGLGARFDYLPWFIFGADVEWEPWFSLSTGNAAHGVFNAALVADFVYGKIRAVELRGHVAAGCSVLLFDLVAADRGSTGPFVGFNALGVAIRATRSLRIVLEPGGLYFSVPQLRGFPLVHRHHRFTVSVQITP